MISFRGCACLALLAFGLLQPENAGATSTFEKLFCGAKESTSSSDLNKCKIPDSPAAVQQALVAAAIASAQPCLRVSQTATATETVDGCTVIPASEAAKLDLAPGMFVPQGRSLQKNSTDLKDPRVLFGMPPAFQLEDKNGKVITFKNPLSKELFVGYSPKAKTLEILSYNREKGVTDFYKVDNYPGADLKVKSHTGEDTCMKCHQAGGPIFPRAPWSETSSSLAVTKALCEKNGGQPFYQGIRFADSCPPTPSAVDANASKQGRLSATAFDIDVRLSSRVLQARNACATMCGSDVACRKLLIKSALKFPRAMTSLARIDTDNPAEAAEVLRFSLLPPRKKGSGTPTGPDAEFTDLEAKLKASLTPGWKPERYSYASSTLPDRDPMTDPSKVTVVPDNSGTAIKTYRESDTGTDKNLVGPRSVADPALSDPATARPKTGAIPAEVAPLYAMDAAFDCLGFQSKDAWAIQSCVGKDAGAIDKILDSSYLTASLKDWPLSPDQSPTAVRNSTMAALASVCGAGGEAAPCPYVSGVLNKIQQALVNQAGQAASAAAPAPAPSAFTQYCLECHSNSPVPVRSPEQMKKYNSEHGNEVCKRLSLLAGQDGRMPEGKTDQEFPIAERAAMLKYLGCGSP